jgi:nucleoid-associated protein EbfC
MKNPLEKLGNLNQMRKQAQVMQKMLAEEEVTVEKNGVKVIMTGDQKIVSLKIDGESAPRVKKAIEKAIKESQKVAAKKMMGSGGLGNF